MSMSAANLGSGMVRRPAADLVSSARSRPSPGTRMTLPVMASMLAFSSKSTQRRPSSSERRRPVAMSKVIGSMRSCFLQKSEVCSLARRSRSWSAVSATAPLGWLLDRSGCTSRTGLAPRTLAITASCRAPRRIDFDWRALVAPCALRMERSAASMRAGVASLTRNPPMNFLRFLVVKR